MSRSPALFLRPWRYLKYENFMKLDTTRQTSFNI